MSTRNVSTVKVNWGLGLFLFLLIYDGALRKWLLPGAEQILFIAKDALLLGLLFYAVLNRSRHLPAALPHAARALLALYAVWVLLESANLNLPSVLVGIWGLKAHLLYASLILLIPMTFGNLDDILVWLTKIYPWVVVPVCILAFAQVASPADSYLNQTLESGTEAISYFGEAGLVRVTGTFSYITGMASFLQVCTVLGVGLFLGGARSRPFLVGLGFVLATLPATGSRSVILIAGVSAVIMLLTAFASGLIGSKMAVRIVMIVALLGEVSFLTQDAAWVALQQRAEEASHDENRIITAFTNAFSLFDLAGFFGFGAGAANLGAPALVKDVAPFSWFPTGTLFEEESGRLVLELGIFGWLISQAMRIALFTSSARLALKGGTRTVRLAAVLALPVMALGMYQGNGVFAPPVGASYYWFCVALLTMAYYEDRKAVMQRNRARSLQLQRVSAL